MYGLRGIPFVPLAVVLDKITHPIWDQQHFSPFKTNNKPTRTSSDIYAFFFLKIVLFFPHFFPCYTTDKQTFSTHFDFHVIVQYKGEANVFLNPKPVDSLNFL